MFENWENVNFMPECLEFLYSWENVIFEFMLSHAGVFGVVVGLGECDFQIYAWSYKSVARIS